LHIDHVVAVEDQGPTELANLWRLCTHHHALKTHKNWKVVGEPGNWDLVPP
jgi:5-methylcytosine-specific restriction endonuclease McrA